MVIWPALFLVLAELFWCNFLIVEPVVLGLGAQVLQVTASPIEAIEPLRQAQEKDGDAVHWTNGKATSSNRAHSMRSLYSY